LGASLGSVAFYGIVAAMVSIVLVIMLGASLHADLRFGGFYVPVIVFLVIIAPAAAIMIGSRDITTLEFERYSPLPQSVVWFLRLCSLALVGLTVVRLGSHLMQRSTRVCPGPTSLLLALIAFVVGNYLLNSAFGAVPSPPSTAAMYASAALIAVYTSRQADLWPVIVSAKLALLLIMLAGVALLAIQPGLVRQVGGAEIRIAGLGFRFFGLAENANSLASLALVNLLLSFYRRFRSAVLEVINVSVTLAALVLAQSQTAWLAAAVAIPVLLLGRFQVRLFSLRALSLSFGALALVGAVALFVSFRYGTHLSISDFATGSRYRALVTLTGRDAIWAVAISEWLAHPLFGYGPSIWNSDYRARIGMDFAFSAHNQFLEALSVAGVVGLLTMVIYTFVLGYLSFKAPRPERGLALGLFVLIAARLFTETPLQISSPFLTEFVSHLLLFAVLSFAHCRAREMQHAVGASYAGGIHESAKRGPRASATASISRREFMSDGVRA